MTIINLFCCCTETMTSVISELTDIPLILSFYWFRGRLQTLRYLDDTHKPTIKFSMLLLSRYQGAGASAEEGNEAGERPGEQIL